MENQNIEWKETWKDEYIKWICGFANAQGGKLIIGKDDNGTVTGISNSQRLLEDIPNKVKDILGIIVDVNLLTENNKKYLEINVEAYPFPVNYKGQYHFRSGSTKQELKGAALDRFLLQKQGKHWDSVPVPNVAIKDLEKSAFDYFKRKAAKSKRISEDDLNNSIPVLLDKLHLTEKKYLKRAAILLFHNDPEKYFTGAYVKIGFFRTDDDLLFQDEIHGNLFQQVEKTMDLLLTKYLRANISYEGIQRVEEYPYPEAALREAVLNAIAHKDYGGGTPIQISVYHDKIYCWNEGQLPENWTVDNLLKKHPSKPYNPDIANAFFRAGFIESWGRGITKMINECKGAKCQIPQFKYDMSGYVIEFYPNKIEAINSVVNMEINRNTDVYLEKSSEKSSEKIKKIISTNNKITVKELQDELGLTRRGIEWQISKLKQLGLLQRIGSDKDGYWELIEKT